MNPAMECPTGCGYARTKGCPMCPVCWHRVPKSLRNDIESAWRQVEGTNDTEAFERYDSLRTTAIKIASRRL